MKTHPKAPHYHGEAKLGLSPSLVLCAHMIGVKPEELAQSALDAREREYAAIAISCDPRIVVNYLMEKPRAEGRAS